MLIGSYGSYQTYYHLLDDHHKSYGSYHVHHGSYYRLRACFKKKTVVAHSRYCPEPVLVVMDVQPKDPELVGSHSLRVDGSYLYMYI